MFIFQLGTCPIPFCYLKAGTIQSWALWNRDTPLTLWGYVLGYQHVTVQRISHTAASFFFRNLVHGVGLGQRSPVLRPQFHSSPSKHWFESSTSRENTPSPLGIDPLHHHTISRKYSLRCHYKAFYYVTIIGVPKVIRDPWMSFHFSLSRLLSDAWPCTFQVLLSPPSVKTRYNSGRGGAWFRLFGLPWGPEVCRDEIELNPMTTLTLTNELVRWFILFFWCLFFWEARKCMFSFFEPPTYVRPYPSSPFSPP